MLLILRWLSAEKTKMENILEINNLHTYFHNEKSVVKAAEGVNLEVKKGEALGLVGESGCGKTITAYSVMQLIQEPGRIERGQILFEGKDLLRASSKDMQKIRGKDIAMVFQEPSMALNPLYRIGFQIGEAIRIHDKTVTKLKARKRVLELLSQVEVPNPEVRINDYPHNLSGGQAQRAVIAIALACKPKLLIADEPTTSLDVTVQAQIMKLFLKLKQEEGFTFILITHDLALCSQVVDRVAIMQAGKIVEAGLTKEVFTNPQHPYTKALFSALTKAG